MIDSDRILLQAFLRKYYKRILKYGDQEINRRIYVNLKTLFKGYGTNHSSESDETEINYMLADLQNKRFIGCIKKNRYDRNYEKAFMNESSVDDIENYLQQRYQIKPRKQIVNEIYKICAEYQEGGMLRKIYIDEVSNELEKAEINISFNELRLMLQVLSAVEKVENSVYLRELSMLVIGDSKGFEGEHKYRYEKLISIMRKACDDYESYPEDLLSNYNISLPDQDISLKGNILIEIGNQTVDVSVFPGGISLQSSDVEKINDITVKSKQFVTVENKTSYLRVSDPESSYLYLGGFGTKVQLKLLKRIIGSNPDVRYCHMGDIDAGGFLIHKNLEEKTNCTFNMVYMGIPELKDDRYQNNLRPLSEADRVRLKNLAADLNYSDVCEYMLDHDCKLEQEIITYREFG